MEIDIIKRVATKYELLTVDFSLNEILVLLKEVPLSSYGRLQVDEGSVVGYVYNYSLPISFLRQELKNEDEIDKFLQNISKMKTCKGFPEKDVKPEVKIEEILIFNQDGQFRIRSRKCTNIKSAEICQECTKISMLKPKGLVSQPPNFCSFCEKKFSSKVQLSKHIRKSHSNAFLCQKENCNKHFGSEVDLNLHIRRHDNDFTFFCDICNKGFVSNRELKLHKVSHENLRSFVCYACGKLFLRKSNLSEHMKIHSGSKNYSCDICDLSFSRPSNLETHKSRRHGGDVMKKFSCNKCDKRFHSMQQLTRHAYVHSGERPFNCDICKTSYARADHLKSHKLKIHHIGEVKQKRIVGKTTGNNDNDLSSPSENLVINTENNAENYSVDEYVHHDINTENILHLDIQEQVTIVHIGH